MQKRKYQHRINNSGYFPFVEMSDTVAIITERIPMFFIMDFKFLNCFFLYF